MTPGERRGPDASEASTGVGTELQLGPLERPVRLGRPRLQTFDYQGTYRYHVIIVTQGREQVFEDIALDRRYLSILEDVASATGFNLVAYCLMPDHLHLLSQGKDGNSHLVTFIQRFKQRTGYDFKRQWGHQLWQPNYFDRVLRQDEDLQTAAGYVLQNPVTEGLCMTPEEYPLFGGSFAVATPAGPN